MKPFGELSNEEKKALLCAWVDGARIEISQGCDTWERIVNPSWFHDRAYRIAPVMPSIGWSHVAPEFKWLAQDRDGSAWIFELQPHTHGIHWHATSNYIDAQGFDTYQRSTVSWDQSLVARPDEEKQQ